MSHGFSSLSLKGLAKAGDIIIPGTDGLPKFSDTEFVHHLGRMSNFMYQDDREGLKLLTAIMALLPSVVVRFIIWIATTHEKWPGFLGNIFRQINIGVRGVIFTLYYSGLEDSHGVGEKIINHLNYDGAIRSLVTEDIEMEQLLSQSNPLLKPFTANADYPMIAETARMIQPEIAALSMDQRLKLVTNIRDVLVNRQEEIVEQIQKETFKARTDVLISEIFPVLEHIEFLIEHAKKGLRNESVPTPLSMMGKKSEVWFEPLGTILIISPWNYPFYQAIVPITCSFITGNATIYKPSELTPLTGLVESVLSLAGWKNEWVQVVYGDGKVGSELIKQRPQKIFFTGSVATGKKIMSQASEYLIPVELELGGKDPMIVFDDVHLERAVKGAAWGGLTTSGQSCTSVERLYIQESIYPKFRDMLIKEVNSIKMEVDKDGNGDMGGMISMKQVEIVADLLKDALKNGATLLTGKDWDFQSRFIPPMVIEGTTHEMRINKEEIFGPVIPIFSFKTEEEVIRLANDSTFGLSASVWSNDLIRAKRVASRIVTGNFSINNVMISEGNHSLPFGGTKDSGIGRYKGVHGLRNFCNLKSVLIDKNSKKIEANWYPYTSTKYGLFTGLNRSLFFTGLKKWTGLVRFGLPLESHSQKAKRSPKS